MIVYLLYKNCNMNYTAIKRAVGYNNKSAVRHALGCIKNRIETVKGFANHVAQLQSIIQSQIQHEETNH